MGRFRFARYDTTPDELVETSASFPGFHVTDRPTDRHLLPRSLRYFVNGYANEIAITIKTGTYSSSLTSLRHAARARIRPCTSPRIRLIKDPVGGRRSVHDIYADFRPGSRQTRTRFNASSNYHRFSLSLSRAHERDLETGPVDPRVVVRGIVKDVRRVI